jgi:hypothetical protein
MGMAANAKRKHMKLTTDTNRSNWGIIITLCLFYYPIYWKHKPAGVLFVVRLL